MDCNLSIYTIFVKINDFMGNINLILTKIIEQPCYENPL